MRDAFARAMTELATKEKDVCLLSGDIGNRMFDAFKSVAPKRFINCGIAEANMMSVAAGMALSGLRPVVYTITPFTTTRCLEQIRVGVAYHEAPVIIVGTGSGLSYAELGPTHHSLEDIGILRTLPGINVLAPADAAELTAQLNEAIRSPGPTYIRIGKKGEPLLNPDKAILGIGKANLIKDGSDVLVLGVGPILSEVIEASRLLAAEGVSVAIANLGSVKPLDNDFLRHMHVRYAKWVSIEEHGVVGGLGSALLEWLSDHRESEVSLKRLGVPDRFIHSLGNQAYVRGELGIDSFGISTAIRQSLAE